MQTRKLGNSDLMITPVGFGAWAIGGGGWAFAWGAQEETDSIAAIHRALELGVNWIDTAAVYGFGHSEKVVARALKEWKGNRPYIFTKCAMRWDDKGAVTKVHTAASIKQECEDSLKRLEIDVIDLYQIHWPPEDNGPTLEESWQAMVDLQKAGKVRCDRRLELQRRTNGALRQRSRRSRATSRPTRCSAAKSNPASRPTAKITTSGSSSTRRCCPAC